MPNQLIPVAIADDHALYRKALTDVINNTAKFTVIIEAKNGQELLEKLKEKRKPVIILLDINMPVMNGFDTFKEIQKTLPHCKVLAISGYSNTISILVMKKLGCHGFISKNVTVQEIEEAIEKVYTTGLWFPMTKNEKTKHTENEELINLIQKLTTREMILFQYMSTDLSYKEIAQKMKITRYTVDDYRNALFEKFKVNSRQALVLIYIKYYLSQANNFLPDVLL